MSTVAIFVTKGTIFAGSAAMSGAFLAMGVGVGAAFYLQYRHEVNEQERQRLTRELNNACYRVRHRIESLPLELHGQFKIELARLAELESSANAAIAKDDFCVIPAAIAALHEQYATLKNRIEHLVIATAEPSQAVLDSALELSRRLDAFTDKPLLIPLRNELGRILKESATDRLEQDINVIAKRAELIISQNQDPTEHAEEPPPAVCAPDSRERRRSALLADARRYHLLIARLDSSAADELLPLLEEAAAGADDQRLSMLRDSICLKYGAVKDAAALTAIHTEVLQSLPDQVRNLPGGPEVADMLEALLKQPAIGLEEFREGLRKSHDLLFKSHEEQALLARVRDTLETLGYATLSGVKGITEEGLQAGEVFFVDTPSEGYRVMLRLSPEGELLTRLVRMVASEDKRKNVSSYQRQKDLDVARRWCRDYDSLISGMEQQGVSCTVNLRKAPEEEEVLCIVDTSADIKRRSHSTTVTAMQGGAVS